VRAKGKSSRLPRVEVVGGGDTTARALDLADGPELVEGRGALDGGLVYTDGVVNVIGTAIGGNGAKARGPTARVIGSEVLDDVVLDERARGPAVNGEVPIAGGVEGPAVVYHLGASGVPADTSDDVLGGCGPAEAVLASVDVHGGAGIVLHPQGVEVSAEVTGAAAGDGSPAHELGGVGERGHGHDDHGRSAESEERGEGDHGAQ